MDKSAKLLLRIAGAARYVIALIVFAYGQWTVFEAVLARVPFYQALAWGALFECIHLALDLSKSS